MAEDRVGQLLDVAKEAYDIVVLDTPPHFHATTLATLDRTDRLVLVTTLDIPTVKNVKLTLQTLNLLHYPRERIALVINRPLPRAELRESDISRTLDLPITFVIPGDKEVGVAVNRGVPVTVSAPRSRGREGHARARRAPAAAVASAEARTHGAGRDGEAQGTEAAAPAKQASAGRQSVFKAGMSRFSKSKDKKAA